MTKQRTDEERLGSLIDSLGDSIFEASSEEIREEFRMSGIDPDAEAARLKGMMLDAVRELRQRALRAARLAYNHHTAQADSKHSSIPSTPEDRRTLFLLISQQPKFTPYVTTQYRDLKNLSDSDIESYLEDLAELGILDNLSGDDTNAK